MFTVEIRNGRDILRSTTCNTAADAILCAKDWAEPYGEYVIAYDSDGNTIAEHPARVG